MKRKLRDIWDKLVTRWPWMSKKSHSQLLSKHTSDLIAGYEAREQEIIKRVDAIVERGCTTNWKRNRERETYQLTIELDPRMVGYGSYRREELHYIARAIGYQVEAEIATSRFIKKATDHDRMQWEPEKAWLAVPPPNRKKRP